MGLVLGHHGSTIQRLQRVSGAKIEIHCAAGNLFGDHPPLADTSLHALVQADSKVGPQACMGAGARAGRGGLGTYLGA